jgi:hypothetical protein
MGMKQLQGYWNIKEGDYIVFSSHEVAVDYLNKAFRILERMKEGARIRRIVEKPFVDNRSATCYAPATLFTNCQKLSENELPFWTLAGKVYD